MVQKSKDSLAEAKAYALRLISVRPRSRRELENRLRKKGYPQRIIDILITNFENTGLIDDRKLAKDIVDIEMQRRGKRGILYRLKDLGFEDEIIVNALEALNDEIEESAAKKIIEKKKRALSCYDMQTVRRRLWTTLKRRGFTSHIIERVMKEVNL